MANDWFYAATEADRQRAVSPEYIRRLEEVANAALALRPIGSPASINQMMRLERALKALTDGFGLPTDEPFGPNAPPIP